MELRECINGRRSVRKYKDEEISVDILKELIVMGTMAATGSGMEPWGFVIIQDKIEIDFWADKTKKYLLDNLDKFPYLMQYKAFLQKPDSNIFNNSRNLIIIYGDTKSHWYKYDCSLAAANIMLSAHEMGIGTCWIGFSEYMLNTKEFKEMYKIPEDYDLVCPLSLGYMTRKTNPAKRKEPLIFTIKNDK